LAIRKVLVYQGDITPAIREADYFDHIIGLDQLLAVQF